MKQNFVTSWKSSVQPRKQRKYSYNAPLHIKGKMLSVNLAKDLRKKFNKRSIRVKKGDKVKIMRGMFKGKSNKVERVDIENCKVFVSGIEIIKKDGSKTTYPIAPSNLQIIELDLGDKKRQKSLDKGKETKKAKDIKKQE